MFHFLKRFILNPTQIGAVTPSSHSLAVQIVKHIPDRSYIAKNAVGQRFLEIGAGTGVFTREIIKKLAPQDLLDVIEYDSDFCEKLQKEFQNQPSVTIHKKSIVDFQSTPYDVVISGLPLNAFNPNLVESILRKYEELTKPEGILSYFEYILIEKIKRAFLFGRAHRDFCKVLEHKKIFIKKHGGVHANVLRNFPPARVQYCMF